MKNIKTTIFTLLWAAGLAFFPVLSLQAAERTGSADAAAFTEIRTYEDLLQMADNPEGSYRLMNNIDMDGQVWTPVDFRGVFDGNGYTLLNLRVESTGAGTADTYDGNHKVYDTYFAGFFGTLINAEVSNLNLVNVQVYVNADLPCIIGSIAGYSKDSTVRGCSVQGTLELLAHDRMFGVGGIIGYGSGSILQTSADVTLICIDTDASTRDEQFMGGAYSAGYIDLDHCTVKIDGYVSEHGYVHNGGLVGMYILYPKGYQYEGFITNNSVSGKITFFEDNSDRRAYCKAIIGEVMNWTFKEGGNATDFKRDEIYDYSADLRPEMCAEPVHTSTVTPPGCNTFGYTTIKCENCGYTYTDHYTLYQHTVKEWTVTQEPTTLATGVKTGTCSLCGVVMTAEIEKLPATPEPAPATDSPRESGSAAIADPPEQAASGHEKEAALFRNPVVIGVIVVLVLLLVAGEIAVFKNKNR